jgi:hypothetical protein
MSEVPEGGQVDNEMPNLRTMAEMKKDLREWGFGLIFIGLVSLNFDYVNIFGAFLDPGWGLFLIVIGILSLLVKNRSMFIIIGISLILAGISNIYESRNDLSKFWIIFGILQLYWGAQEIRKFGLYSKISN